MPVCFTGPKFQSHATFHFPLSVAGTLNRVSTSFFHQQKLDFIHQTSIPFRAYEKPTLLQYPPILYLARNCFVPPPRLHATSWQPQSWHIHYVSTCSHNFRLGDYSPCSNNLHPLLEKKRTHTSCRMFLSFNYPRSTLHPRV